MLVSGKARNIGASRQNPCWLTLAVISLLFFVGGPMQSSILSREARKVRIPAVERVELARKRQGEEYCPKGKILV